MSDDHTSDHDHARRFSVDEADALVPHLVQVFVAISQDREALHTLASELTPFGVDLSAALSDTLARHPALRAQIEELARVKRRLKGALAGLSEMGVEVKDIEGLVDLRSRYQGRVVYLCWKLGEARFTHWHELDSGYGGRQAIVDRAAFEGTLLN